MIVGFTGYKTAGKDTAAEVLIRRGWAPYALADPLRAVCRELFGWSPGRMLHKEKVDPYWGISPRQAMQTVGTELIRHRLAEIHPTTERFWVKRMGMFAAQNAGNIVVTDVRFPDEAEAIHDLGGMLIRVNRPGRGADGHESESYIASLPADYDVDNSGNIEQLHDQVIAAVHCDE